MNELSRIDRTRPEARSDGIDTIPGWSGFEWYVDNDKVLVVIGDPAGYAILQVKDALLIKILRSKGYTVTVQTKKDTPNAL